MVKVASVLGHCLFAITICTVFFFTVSCTSEEASYGKLSFYNSSGKKSFSFTVSDVFIAINQGSAPDKIFPRMKKAEMTLLKKFLRSSNQCIGANNELSFLINSRQEKVYDVTFSSLVEQNYNARSVTPVTYFGECI